MLLATFCNLMLGMLGGFSVVSHSHDGHGVHWHAAKSPEAATILAAAHLEAHRSEQADASHAHFDDYCPGHQHREHDAETPDNQPAEGDHGGLLVTVPDHEQVNRRAGEVVLAASTESVSVPPLPEPGLSPAIIDALSEPVFRGRSAVPRHLCALRASERLVATSRALLI